MPLQLSGQVDTRDQQIAELQLENEKLRDYNLDLEQQLRRARIENQQSISAVRAILSPLYNGLKQLFGEMDAIGGAQEQATTKEDPRWASWKQRMPGRPAEMIDLLLVHDSMSVKNLMVAMKCRKDAVYQAASKLGQAGVVANVGGRYSLKN